METSETAIDVQQVVNECAPVVPDIVLVIGTRALYRFPAGAECAFCIGDMANHAEPLVVYDTFADGALGLLLVSGAHSPEVVTALWDAMVVYANTAVTAYAKYGDMVSVNPSRILH